MIKLDLNKFKHVRSDDKTTTLKHKDGHELTIAHSALGPKMRSQLQALASGGTVESGSPTMNMKDGGIAEAFSEQAKKGNLGTGPKLSEEEDEKKKPKADPTKREDIEGSDSPKQKSAQEAFDQHMREEAAKNKDQEEYANGGMCYADGGDVQNPENPQVSIPQVDSDTQEARNIYNDLKMGGNLDPFSMSKVGPLGSNTDIFGPEGQTPTNFDPNTWAQARQKQQDIKTENAAKTAGAQQAVIAKNQALVDAGLPPEQVPDVPSTPQMPGMEAVKQETQAESQGIAPQQPPTSPLSGAEETFSKGLEQRLASIDANAKAQDQLAKDKEAALMHQQDIMGKAQAEYQQNYHALEQERQALVKDVQDGHIDPEKFWDNHSKIATAIGIIIAGFNPTNSPNAAINYLKFNMEQNLEAQKQNLANKQNLLSFNMRQFGNLRDAMEMTRIQQNDVVQNQLQLAAAKATSPLAKAAAMEAAGQLRMESAPMLQQFAMRRTFMNMASNSPNGNNTPQLIQMARMSGNEPLAKSLEERYIPGVGTAQVPVPEKVREQMGNYQQADSAIRDLQQFVKTHTTINPLSADYATGEQKALALQALVRESKLGTVYREGEQPLLDKFVSSNPAGAMKMIKTTPQLSELLRSNIRGYNVLKRQYGLPESAAPAENFMEGKTAVNAQGKRIIMKNGKWEPL